MPQVLKWLAASMIIKVLPNPIDQMKFFELIRIIPSPAQRRSILRCDP
jgi:hypothetical protein